MRKERRVLLREGMERTREKRNGMRKREKKCKEIKIKRKVFLCEFTEQRVGSALAK